MRARTLLTQGIFNKTLLSIEIGRPSRRVVRLKNLHGSVEASPCSVLRNLRVCCHLHPRFDGLKCPITPETIVRFLIEVTLFSKF